MSGRRGYEHSVSVPDYIYRYAQQVTGLTVPTAKLHEFLSRGMDADKADRTIVDTTVPAPIPEKQPSLFTEDDPDRGKPIKLRTGAEICTECGDVIERGQYAVIRTNERGSKEFSCLPARHKSGAPNA